MRVTACLTLLLSLATPAAFAAGPYQVEMLLLRQNGVAPVTSAFAPEDWRGGAPLLGHEAERPTRLNDEVTRLTSTGEYTVLLHKAWQQPVGGEPSAVAVSEGDEQYGQFPIEGWLSLAEGRFTQVEARFWVNELDGNGGVQRSEQFWQNNRNVKNGQLTYLDGGHLAVLIRVQPVGMKPLPDLNPEAVEP